MQIGYISVHNQNIDGAVWTPDVYPINETAKLTHDYAAYLRNWGFISFLHGFILLVEDFSDKWDDGVVHHFVVHTVLAVEVKDMIKVFGELFLVIDSSISVSEESPAFGLALFRDTIVHMLFHLHEMLYGLLSNGEVCPAVLCLPKVSSWRTLQWLMIIPVCQRAHIQFSWPELWHKIMKK